MMPGLLRAGAIVIAVAGAIDPAITTMRRTRPELAVVGASANNAALVEQVARELGGRFTIIRAPFAGAAATVLAGDRLPPFADELAVPGFAVAPPEARVRLDAVSAPARTSLDAVVPITVVAQVVGGKGRRLEVSASTGGVVTDRTVVEVPGDDRMLRVPLTFVPTATGAVALIVTAALSGTQSRATAGIALDVRAQRWAVLCFDARPSWASTFVRRALERDPRFLITSRVMTSTAISTAAGRAPASLEQLGNTESFDAVVVGAPEALNDADVAALETFMRRGGSVVLLLDHRASGAFDRLTRVTEWTAANVATTLRPTEIRGRALRAAEVIWPAELPDGAEPIAVSDSSRRPVIWRSAVGAGQLVVSGALDAWHYRDAASFEYDKFWQMLIADVADAALQPIEVRLGNGLLEPGESTDVIVTLRDPALAGAASGAVTVSAALESVAQRTTVRLWPDGTIGQFRGSLRAPEEPGTYSLVVNADGARSQVTLIVVRQVAHPEPMDRDLLGAWARSRGGSLVLAPNLKGLSGMIASSVEARRRHATAHPMRSLWWLIPFTLLLGAEWWWRRRRGLA